MATGVDNGRLGRCRRKSLTTAAISSALVPLMCACVGFYWTMQRLGHLDNLPSWVKTLAPRLVYGLSLLGVLLRFFGRRRHAALPPSRARDTKVEAFSSLLAALSGPLVLILGPGAVWTFISLIAQAYLFIVTLKDCQLASEVLQEVKKEDRGIGKHSHKIPNDEGVEEERGYVSVVWALLSVYYFYATGHDCTFSSLQWETAFLGLEEYNFIAGGLLVTINTWASQVVFVLLLPLLVTYTHHRTPARKTPEGSLRQQVLKVMFLFMSCFALKVFLTTAFVYSQRRHLMVWKVFAPKFIFDGATLLIVDSFLLLTYLLFIGTQ